MIQITGVFAENFMCFEHLTFYIKDHGFYFIEGENRDEEAYKRSNGSGKTAIMDAIAWGLYGRTLRELDKGGVIRNGTEVAEVRLSFFVHASTPHGSVYKQHYALTRRDSVGKPRKLCLTRFSLKLASDDASGGTTEETQKKIESLIGMGWKEFCSSVVFGGSSRFKFSALSNQERKSVLDKAVGAEIYTSAKEVAAQEKKDAETKHVHAERTYAEAVSRVQERLSQLKDAKRVLAEAIRASGRYVPPEKNPQALKKIVDHLEARWEAQRERNDELRSSLDGYEREVFVAKEAATELRKHLEALRTEEGPCPVCGSTKFERQDAMEKIALSLKGKEAKSSVFQYRLVAVREKLAEGVRREGSLRSKLRDAREDLVEANLALGKAEAANDASAIDKLKDVVTLSRSALLKAKELRKQRREELKQAEQRVDFFLYLEKCFGGLVTKVIEAAVPILNEKAKEVADKLADGNLSVEFSTVGETKKGKRVEKLDLDVKNAKGASSYAGSSQGERGAADLVAGMAIQELVSQGAQCNVAFYDEALDSLDAVAGERVLQALREQSKTKAVFLISHAEWVRDFQFDGVVKVIKEGDKSRIEVVS